MSIQKKKLKWCSCTARKRKMIEIKKKMKETNK